MLIKKRLVAYDYYNQKKLYFYSSKYSLCDSLSLKKVIIELFRIKYRKKI